MRSALIEAKSNPEWIRRCWIGIGSWSASERILKKKILIQTNLCRYEYKRQSDLGHTESPWWIQRRIANKSDLERRSTGRNGMTWRRSNEWRRNEGTRTECEKLDPTAKQWGIMNDHGSEGLLWMRQTPNGNRNVTLDGLSDHQQTGQNGLDWWPDGRTAGRAIQQIDGCVAPFLGSECLRNNRKIRPNDQTYDAREETPKNFTKKKKEDLWTKIGLETVPNHTSREFDTWLLKENSQRQFEKNNLKVNIFKNTLLFHFSIKFF